MAARILVLPGSTRSGSFNGKLAAEAARLFALTDCALTLASLSDYPLPIYDADHETQDGVPHNAVLLAQRIAMQDALLIVSPEYNSSVPPLVKNALDWASRVRTAGDRPLRSFAGLVVGLASASPTPGGGRNACVALRLVLQSLGAEIVTRQCNVALAGAAFGEDGRLAGDRERASLEALVESLLDHARALGRHL